jgi:malate synthase
MWAKPDEYKEMMDVKYNQLKSGASCAWIPSPTAATLHAIHYHDYFVRDYQESLKKDNEEDTVRHILSPSVTSKSKLKTEFIQKELDANIQSILGYVVHWINSGTGCSKVPDINNTYLMEDRATLRISSQHVANWLLHDVCSKNDVIQSMNKMAVYVDKQNENVSEYINLQLKNGMSIAMQAAHELIFNGVDSPNGYTEDILRNYRKLLKKNS